MPNILEVLQVSDMLVIATKAVPKSSEGFVSLEGALKDSVARSAA